MDYSANAEILTESQKISPSGWGPLYSGSTMVGTK